VLLGGGSAACPKLHAGASLGMVSPGAVTDGVILFFPEKLTLFKSSSSCPDPFSLVTTHTPAPHLPTHRFSSTLCKIKFTATFFSLSSGCHPLDGVTRGGPTPPLPARPLMAPLASRRQPTPSPQEKLLWIVLTYAHCQRPLYIQCESKKSSPPP